MELRVRKAEEKDIERIAHIHVKTWQCAYKGQIPDEYLAKLSLEKRNSMWTDAIRDPHENRQILVAELDGKVIGFCSGGPSRDEDADKTPGEVYAIYIDQDNLGKGAGSALMKEIFQFLKDKGFYTVSLWVLATNQLAKKFYEKHGWKFDGHTKTELKDGVTFHEERFIKDL